MCSTLLRFLILFSIASVLVHGQAPRVRGLYEAFRVSDGLSPPYDTGRMKILYPASEETAFFTEAKDSDAPFPVIVFIGGPLVESNRYQWLGERLVEDNDVVFVSYDILGVLGEPSIITETTQAFDVETPSEVLETVFKKLRGWNRDGILAGKLDLERVVLGGHSAGGTMALMNGNEDFFPGVVGVFTYASHLATGSVFGFPPASIIPLTSTVPILLMGGTEDGVIMSLSYRSDTEWTSPTEPIERTFDEAFPSGKPVYYMAFNGFNHLALVDPIDTTVGSGFNDSMAAVEKDVMKERLVGTISLFVREHVFEDEEAADELMGMVNDPPRYISSASSKT